MRDVLIIGAGASGLVAAIAAAGAGSRVTILDKNARAGRKLLLTGNGHCNLSNTDSDLWFRFNGSDAASLKKAVYSLKKQFDTKKTLSFFLEQGLLTSEHDGFIYPASMQASSVVQVLLRACERLGVKMKYSETVLSVARDEHSGKWHAGTQGWTYSADALILCCGSPACPEGGGSMAGYGLVKETGHSLIAPRPALTGLLCEGPGLREAKGARTNAMLSVLEPDPLTGAPVCRIKEYGQIQWTGDGISGIVAFQVSSFVSSRLAGGANSLTVEADLFPGETEQSLAEKISVIFRGISRQDVSQPTVLQDPKQILKGMIHERLVPAVIGHFRGRDVTAVELGHVLKHLSFRVKDTYGFDRAQVSAGGVPLSEINPDTFESKLQKDLFFAGEMLDADGPCGGYNLQWAWSTGYVAGSSAAKAGRE